MNEQLNSDPPGDASKDSPSISVFFPCYNEASNVGSMVEKTIPVLASLTPDFEIILVNDGSSDGTAEIIETLAEKNPCVKAVHHRQNSGYGAALQSGFRAASKDLVFYTDGDAQFDIGELGAIIPLIRQYDIVSCYRLDRKEGLIRKINAWCWSRLVCRIFSMKIKDIDCAFKLFKRRIFDDIEMHSTGALIDTEILARAVKKGYTVTQAGVHHYPRTAGEQTGANLGVILKAFKELYKLRRQILGSS